MSANSEDAFEQVALARIQREVSLLRAQAARRTREQNALLMNAGQWAAVYGSPIPGSSKTMAQLAAEAQANARGRVYGGGGGPEVVFGRDPWAGR